MFFLSNRKGKAPSRPISTATLATFIAYLDISGYAASTITTYVSAITYVHRLASLQDPANSFLIRKLLEGINKRKPKKSPLLPISLDLLKAILQVLDRKADPYNQKLLKTAFSLAFYLCARVGEIALSNGNLKNVIKLHQVSLLKRGSHVTRVKVTFLQFKHKKPRQESVRSITSSGDTFCPVKILQDYLQVRGSQPGPLLLSKNKKVLKGELLARELKVCLRELGLDETRYNTHSFRIGGATEAAERGATDTQLRLLGRWKSSAFLNYIRPNAFQFKY